MQESAKMFSQMASVNLAKNVAVYRETGHHLLRLQVVRLAHLNPDLVRVRVVDVEGRLAMDATITKGEVLLSAYPQTEAPLVFKDPVVLRQIQELELSAYRVRGPRGRRLFRVIAPAVETWGQHTFSIVADFSYSRVNGELFHTALVTLFFLALAMVFGYSVAVLLARSITQSLEELHRGVREMSADRLGERVVVHSGDEIEDLAEAFNAMADRLQASIAALQEAYTRLESLDQAKRNLLANVSHELKTPLTAIRGYVELLQEGMLGEMTPPAQRAVEVCQNNVLRLSARVEELVELARLDRDDVLAVTGPVDLSALLRGILETVRPRLEQKRQTCAVRIEQGLPIILGSAEHLERAVINLVDNAIKFTPEAGTIRISAWTLDERGEPGVEIVVEDTGVGIPEKDLAAVFERFFQVDPSSRRRYGGMGLGLALVQRAVELHGGRVWARSILGEGTVFHIWLPVSGAGGWSASGRGSDTIDTAEKLADVEDQGGVEP
ncbi:MAG TPA: HAMP domain-containing histidine kinase [Acidobacteria bacterium]|nr:HAMP domain-containing histidine kinase [Acidobacteriota bacterium]